MVIGLMLFVYISKDIQTNPLSHLPALLATPTFGLPHPPAAAPTPPAHFCPTGRALHQGINSPNTSTSASPPKYPSRFASHNTTHTRGADQISHRATISPTPIPTHHHPQTTTPQSFSGTLWRWTASPKTHPRKTLLTRSTFNG